MRAASQEDPCKAPQNFVPSVTEGSSRVRESTEMVEHKGVGHPDSHCDGAVEAAACTLSQAYRESYGTRPCLSAASAPHSSAGERSCGQFAPSYLVRLPNFPPVRLSRSSRKPSANTSRRALGRLAAQFRCSPYFARRRQPCGGLFVPLLRFYQRHFVRRWLRLVFPCGGGGSFSVPYFAR